MKKDNRIDIDSDALNIPFAQLIGYDSILTPITLPPHFHGGYEIVFLEKGDTVFELPNNNQIHIHGGNFSIIHPGTIHKGEWEIIKPCTLFWIVFDFSSANTANGYLQQPILFNNFQEIYRHVSHGLQRKECTKVALKIWLENSVSDCWSRFLF